MWPDLMLKRPNGSSIPFPAEVKEIAGTKGLVVTFFQTWCAACKPGLEALTQHRKALNEAGIKVILLHVREPVRDPDTGQPVPNASYLSTNQIYDWLETRNLAQFPHYRDANAAIATEKLIRHFQISLPSHFY